MFSRLSLKITITLLLITWLLVAPPAESSHHSPAILAPQLKLEDDLVDLAIGVYHEDRLGKADCGAAHIFYGKELMPYYWSPSQYVD